MFGSSQSILPQNVTVPQEQPVFSQEKNKFELGQAMNLPHALVQGIVKHVSGRQARNLETSVASQIDPSSRARFEQNMRQTPEIVDD